MNTFSDDTYQAWTQIMQLLDYEPSSPFVVKYVVLYVDRKKKQAGVPGNNRGRNFRRQNVPAKSAKEER